MKIKEIHKKIIDLFNQNKIPWLTCNLPMENLHSWAISTKKRLKLKDTFESSVTELFWTMSQIQISLGNALIAKESCKYTKGTKGVAYTQNQVPNMIEIPEIHFWHHVYCCVECIYRCWERITIILKDSCYPDCSEKLYFDGMITMLDKDKIFNINPKFHKLKQKRKSWNTIASYRNKLSHHQSSPFKRTKINGEVSNLCGPRGEYLFKLEYSSDNLNIEVDKMKNMYLKLLPVMKSMKEFIDHIKR